MALEPARMTKLRKAAVVLLAMGEEATAQVFRHLDAEEVEALAKEIADLGHVSTADTEQVVEEFHSTAVGTDVGVRGGAEFARRVMSRTYGEETGARMARRVTGEPDPALAFPALQEMDPQQLSKFLVGEHPQTIALVLAHMPVPAAAKVVALLPETLRIDVITRMANLDDISPDVVVRVSGVLQQRLKTLGGNQRTGARFGGIRTVAALCNRLERHISGPVLEAIESKVPDLAVSIRNLMFVFDDLASVDDNGLRELVQRADRKTLTLALKGAADEVKRRVYGNMSKRAAEMLRDEIDVMGAVRVRDVEKAQQAMVALARTLEQEGVLVLQEGDGDAYVK